MSLRVEKRVRLRRYIVEYFLPVVGEEGTETGYEVALMAKNKGVAENHILNLYGPASHVRARIAKKGEEPNND